MWVTSKDVTDNMYIQTLELSIHKGIAQV